MFTILIYLSIGPCLAIPRTASTSFEMAVPPFLPEGTPLIWFRLGYSALFFGAAFLVALRPEKLTSRLGRLLCPLLLALVAVMFLGCLIHPVGGYGPALPPYDSAAPVEGFLTGYQTMDTIAALNFGIVIVMNIRALGVTEEKAVLRSHRPGQAEWRRCCSCQSTPCWPISGRCPAVPFPGPPTGLLP